MTQRARQSPVLGYNHNLRHGGRVFHVQTEDSGQGYARLHTHLFYEGTILSSKKLQYDAQGVRVTNNQTANDYLSRDPRKGFELR